MTNPTATPTPAQQLVGKQLPNRWAVQRLIARPQSATGGYFSTSYIVTSADGQEAFLKAMDYTRALQANDPANALQAMTAAYNFERALLEKCMSHNLSRIVQVLDSGTLPAPVNDPSGVVQYLIFELATGDIRTYLNFNQSFNNAWVLRIMHQSTAALRQLHYAQIAHQDLKPSNVLIFDNSFSKLGDLGRAFDLHSTSPHDVHNYAGDRTYAPPELLYGQVHQDWRIRRIACDLYLLGSLLVFLYTGVSITHLIFKRLDPKHHYTNWGDSYSAVLPYVQAAFAQILRDLRQAIPRGFVDDVVELIKQLCDPDPQKRGHPKNRLNNNSNPYSVERYVSIRPPCQTRRIVYARLFHAKKRSLSWCLLQRRIETSFLGGEVSRIPNRPES